MQHWRTRGWPWNSCSGLKHLSPQQSKPTELTRRIRAVAPSLAAESVQKSITDVHSEGPWTLATTLNQIHFSAINEHAIKYTLVQ